MTFFAVRPTDEAQLREQPTPAGHAQFDFRSYRMTRHAQRRRRAARVCCSEVLGGIVRLQRPQYLDFNTGTACVLPSPAARSLVRILERLVVVVRVPIFAIRALPTHVACFAGLATKNARDLKDFSLTTRIVHLLRLTVGAQLREQPTPAVHAQCALIVPEES